MKFPLILLSASVFVAGPLRAAEPAGWPAFNCDGDFVPPVVGIELIDKADEASKGWQHDVHTGLGKSDAKPVAPLAAEGIEAFYGGVSSLVAADGVVFATFIRPTGDVLNEKTTNRYFKNPTAFPPSIRRIDADDVSVAIDIETGKTLWMAEEKGKGMNYLGGKRGHFGPSPAVHDGRFFNIGSTGRVYAYDAKTGKKLWESHVGGWHENAEKRKQEALAERAIIDTYNGMNGAYRYKFNGIVAADGVVVVPDMANGLIGMNPENGEQIWKAAGVNNARTTPALWRHDGKTHLVATDGRNIRLLDIQTNKELWKLEPGGPNDQNLVVGDDHLLANTRGNTKTGAQGPKTDEEGTGLVACYRLALEGAEKVWTLPNEKSFWTPVRGDSARHRRFAIRDGKIIAILGANKGEATLNCLDLKTGNILSSIPADQSRGAMPILAEDRVILNTDPAHNSGCGYSIFALDADGKLTPLGALPRFALLITGYEGPMETPYTQGRLFAKGERGVVCIDVRKSTRAE